MNNLIKLTRFSQLLVRLPQRSRILIPQVPVSFPNVQTVRYTQTKGDQPQESKPSNDIPEVKFKTYDVKKIFKEFYSLYGPLFIVCHIGVSLTSLGLFSTIVWFNIDPMHYAPNWLAGAIGETALRLTGSGGKFVIAYAIHKLILPVRLATAIYLTQRLSKIFKKKQ